MHNNFTMGKLFNFWNYIFISQKLHTLNKSSEKVVFAAETALTSGTSLREWEEAEEVVVLDAAAIVPRFFDA